MYAVLTIFSLNFTFTLVCYCLQISKIKMLITGRILLKFHLHFRFFTFVQLTQILCEGMVCITFSFSFTLKQSKLRFYYNHILLRSYWSEYATLTKMIWTFLGVCLHCNLLEIGCTGWIGPFCGLALALGHMLDTCAFNYSWIKSL